MRIKYLRANPLKNGLKYYFKKKTLQMKQNPSEILHNFRTKIQVFNTLFCLIFDKGYTTN